MKSLAVCSLLVLLAVPAAGLEPYLVKDIDPAPEPTGSNPSHLVTLGGAALFFANDGISGRQLWRSDGTAAGTWQLSEAPAGLGEPAPYAVTERLYFFNAAQGLWVSDGTPAGTLPLTERVRILPSRVWVASQGVLYFAGQDFEHGAELWRTDGTVAGTRLVADVHEGPAGSGLRWLTEYRGRVWFGAVDEHRGGALWVSDGTAAGTVPAIDPLRSWMTKPPEFIQVVNGRLTFFARAAGPSRDAQLWAGDGTREGTVPVTRLAGRTGRPSLYESVVWGNRLYFVAEDRAGQELWVSDGTRRGTRPLTRFANPQAFFSSSGNWSLPRQLGLPGRFLFVADDGVHGAEPWITDGTPRGTRLLRDTCPGACSSVTRFWVAFAGRLYFSAYDVDHGIELWSTDGTEAGTRLVIDLNPESSSYPYAPFVLGDRLLFVAREGQGGEEIWSTDGTAAGTVRVSDFEPEFIWIPDGFHGAVLNGQLLFGADDGAAGMELWRTDGTAAGTRLVEDINRADSGGSRPYGFRALGSQAIFAASEGGAQGLWKSDGTAAGTVRFKTFVPGTVEGAIHGASAEAGGLLFYFSSSPDGRYLPWRTDGTDAGTFRLTEAVVPGCCLPQEMRAVGSTVFFDLQDGEHGRELWASDGTREGTRLVRDVQPGAGSSDPRELTVFQGRLWFTAAVSNPGFTGRELWVSDGTAAGTARFKDLFPEGAFGPALLTVHAGRLWFFADDEENGRVLWSSDGTAAGTVPAVDFSPEAFLGLLPRFMASLGGRLVVSIDGRGLWATDGTPAATRKIHELEVDSGSFAAAWIVFQDRLYYVAGFTGDVWVTDGTADGTRPLLDRDGEEVSLPSWLAVLGGHLLFAARDELGPTVLWQSDGTPAGTFRFEPPLFPGFGPVRAGERVFFPGYDPATGWELWAARP